MSNLPKKTILDKDGNDVLPITHVSAVYDDNGTSVETLLTNINELIEEKDIIRGYLYNGSFYNKTFTPIDKEYILIGDTKWATMNLGASSVTDFGLYFQWGDILGYTASLLGSGDGLKLFSWSDYKYNPSGDGLTMTKYNSIDNKTTLELADDAANVIWGDHWRIPTQAEWDLLFENTNLIYVSNYQSSGINGFTFTDKTDNTKVLFFPFAGMILNSTLNGLSGSSYEMLRLITSSIDIENIEKNKIVAGAQNTLLHNNLYDRCAGYSIRAIVDDESTPVVIYPSVEKLYIDLTTNKMYIYNGSTYVKVSASEDISGKEDALTIETISSGTTLTAEANKYYKFTSNVGTLAITLPTMSTTVTKPVGLILSFTTGSSPAVTISSAGSQTINYFSDYSIRANKSYELNCLWNGTKWIIAYGTIN